MYCQKSIMSPQSKCIEKAGRPSSPGLVGMQDAGRSGRGNLNATRLRLRLLRNRHLDDAVTAAGLHVGGIHGVGQREAAVEPAVRTLGAAALDVLGRDVLHPLAA